MLRSYYFRLLYYLIIVVNILYFLSKTKHTILVTLIWSLVASDVYCQQVLLFTLWPSSQKISRFHITLNLTAYI